MKIILLKEIKNLGKKGEIVDVKNGYAKNYLFPRQMALLAIKNNVSHVEEYKSITDSNKIYNEFNKLNNISIIIPVTVKDKDSIYGSINTRNLDKLFKKLNLQINTRHLKTDILIKKLGRYKLEFDNKKYDFKTTIYVVLVKKNK